MSISCVTAEEILYGHTGRLYPYGVRTAPDHITLSSAEKDVLRNSADYLRAFGETSPDGAGDALAEELLVLYRAERIGHSPLVIACLDQAAERLEEVGLPELGDTTVGNVFDPLINDLHELSALISSLPSAA